MNLTIQNYHSPEANREYMSSHQFNDFMECPARAKAVVNGKWTDPNKVAYIIGGFLDCALLTPENLHVWWIDNLPAMRELKLVSVAKKTEDEPLAKLQEIKAAVDDARGDAVFMSMLKGEHQCILTPEMYGTKWKCALDVLSIEKRRIVDLKKVGVPFNEKQWYARCDIWLSLAIRAGEANQPKRQCDAFYNAFNYWRQLCVYHDAVKAVHGFQPSLALAASRDKKDDQAAHYARRIFSFIDDTMSPQELGMAYRRLDRERQYIEENIEHVLAWKTGEKEPPRCECCDYCEATAPTTVVTADPGIYDAD